MQTATAISAGEALRWSWPHRSADTLPARSVSPTTHDVMVVARVRAGDEQAARELVERLYTTVIKIVRSHLPRRSSEEDLVQAIFVKMFRNLDQFSSLVPLEHWVSRIAVNTCLNQIKHEKRRPELRMADLNEEEQAVLQKLNSTTDDIPASQTKAAGEVVQKLLGRLKPDERTVVTLLHLEERSTQEISRLTGWSVAAVKVKAFRARQKMRKSLATLTRE